MTGDKTRWLIVDRSEVERSRRDFGDNAATRLNVVMSSRNSSPHKTCWMAGSNDFYPRITIVDAPEATCKRNDAAMNDFIMYKGNGYTGYMNPNTFKGLNVFIRSIPDFIIAKAGTTVSGFIQLRSIADINANYAKFAATYNAKNGFLVVGNWNSGNCCFPFTNGKYLQYAGTWVGPTSYSGGAVSITCNGNYQDGTYMGLTEGQNTHTMKTLPVLDNKFQERDCGPNNNPAIFMKI